MSWSLMGVKGLNFCELQDVLSPKNYQYNIKQTSNESKGNINEGIIS